MSYQSFPIEALPHPLGDFVRGNATAMGCDASYLAMPLLSALAAAIGNTHVVILKSGWAEPAILWTGVVGKSGSLKTPAQKAVLRPIRLREQALIQEWRRALEGYNSEKARNDALPKKQRGTGPLPPTCVRLTVADVTVEALALRLQENPRGLLVVRDELAALFGGFNAYKARGAGADEAHWLSLHSGEPLLKDRAKDGGTFIHVPKANVSITGGIQPGALMHCLTPYYMRNGMAARWLLAMPPWRAKRWTDAEPDPEIDDAMARVFDRLYAIPLRVDANGAPNPIPLGFSRSAKSMLTRFLDEHNAAQEQLDDDASAAWSKLEGYCPRLALVLHLAEWASRCVSGEPVSIQSTTVESAIRLTRWFSAEALRVYGMLGEGDEARELRGIVERIQRMGGRVSVRDWQRVRHHASASEAEAELAGLVQAELGNWEHPAPARTGGKPGKVFMLSRDKSPCDSSDSDNTHAGASESGVSSPVTPSQAETVAANADGWGEV